MSVRVVRTRNGEDVICDIREISQEGDKKVLGYQLNKPYTIWISEGIQAETDDGDIHKLSNPEITMEPYVPLAKEQKIIVRYDEIISAYETHDDVLNKYNQLTEAQSGRGNDAGATESNPVETEIGISVGEGDGA